MCRRLSSSCVCCPPLARVFFGPLWSLISSPSPSGRCHATAFEFIRPLRGRNRRPALVGRSTQLRIPASLVHVLGLCCNRRDVPFVVRSFFLCRSSGFHPAIAAVVADPRVVHDHRLVVNVVHHRHIHVGHFAVIVEVSAVPVAALVAAP